MYEYRKLTTEQKAELVKYRLNQGYPAHSPPHIIRDREFYLLTATCYEHHNYMLLESRRHQLLQMIYDRFKNGPNEDGSAEEITTNINIFGWVILPNHYHFLVQVKDFDILSNIFKRVHGKLSREWNIKDNLTKRKIWYRWSDRAIRSERHYYTTLNYIHYNPVKHNWVKSPYDWVDSSVHWYLQIYGKQWLRDAWVQYPVKDYGKDWDDI
jgi:putative transposase